MNSPQLNRNGRAVAEAMKEGKTQTASSKTCSCARFSRLPTAQEVERFSAYVGSAADARVGYGDILWALLNTS